MDSFSVAQKLIVSGEDEESEEEIDIEYETPVVVVPVNDPTLMNAGNGVGRENILMISSGEAPESDIEVDFDSTISSNSVEDSMSTFTAGRLLGSGWSHFLNSGIILPKSSARLDPSVLKKHKERNRSLRTNIFDRFLTPVISNSIKKIDKLSQGLSNSQMQVQDALFQSRVATANLLKLQAEIEAFVEADYLRDLKTIHEVQGIHGKITSS